MDLNTHFPKDNIPDGQQVQEKAQHISNQAMQIKTTGVSPDTCLND